MRGRQFLVASLTLVYLATPLLAGVGVSVGIGFGPRYPRPCYAPGYFRPYPVFLIPPPPPAIVVTPAPVVALPAPLAEAPVPPPVPTAPAAATTPVARGAAPALSLEALNDPNPQARADALIQLGRNRDQRAVGPIVRALREDTHPQVREAAARALGLIGSPAGLVALQNAAQADQDRDVRRTASFAAEVIRASMRR